MPQENNRNEKPEKDEWPGIIEAILFVSGNAVEREDLGKAMNLTAKELDEALDLLESEYDFNRRGLRLLRFGAHVQLATRPDYAKYVEHLLQPVQKQSLSQAIMETLAVIAYRQPVTKAEVEQIRGVKCDYSVQSLIAKGLIEEAGRKEALGRPILYRTTDAFLRHFCISSLDELPEIDFASLAKEKEETPAVEEGTFDIGTTVSGQPTGTGPADSAQTGMTDPATDAGQQAATDSESAPGQRPETEPAKDAGQQAAPDPLPDSVPEPEAGPATAPGRMAESSGNSDGTMESSEPGDAGASNQ